MNLKLLIINAINSDPKNYKLENLWCNIRKINKNVSYIEFLYLIDKMNKTNIYERKIYIKIKPTRKFYNKLLIFLIKNKDYQIKNRFPITNKKLSSVIKKYKLRSDKILEFQKLYSIKETDYYNIDDNIVIIEEPIYYLLYLFYSFLFSILLYFIITIQ